MSKDREPTFYTAHEELLIAWSLFKVDLGRFVASVLLDIARFMLWINGED